MASKRSNVWKYFDQSTSQQEHNTHRSSTVGCQTDRTQTVECKVSAISVATQLARETLKSAHVRSKGIQATKNATYHHRHNPHTVT
ncbi:hypothetical protein CgunFtcFv8_013993 [Champsocephalus gunnari]|uniref:Uncharacterized protein n=1 Tax=Champsocephalus gunnari TaxID=52237 RepID=A0AAN8HZG2_CHAGU|nr:hypothetical protein CgunFtcFv8_013993 [Champsocephalus gunnari]